MMQECAVRELADPPSGSVGPYGSIHAIWDSGSREYRDGMIHSYQFANVFSDLLSHSMNHRHEPVRPHVRTGISEHVHGGHPRLLNEN